MQQLEILGTTVELRFVCDTNAPIEEWFTALWKEIETFQNSVSRFISTSELSLFNQHAGEQVVISNEFQALLLASAQYQELSKGLFTPFVLPALQRTGYLQSLLGNGSEVNDYSSFPFSSKSTIEIGPSWARIPKQTAIELGGIGKGYLADQLRKNMAKYTEDYCLSLGGDISVSGNDLHGPWVIAVETGTHITKEITYTSNEKTFGIATSATVRTKNGNKQPHIIDPRTGSPIESPYELCTVVAPTTTSADVFASCILIGGEAFADELLAKNLVQAVLLQSNMSTEIIQKGTGFNITSIPNK